MYLRADKGGFELRPDVGDTGYPELDELNRIYRAELLEEVRSPVAPESPTGIYRVRFAEPWHMPALTRRYQALDPIGEASAVPLQGLDTLVGAYVAEGRFELRVTRRDACGEDCDKVWRVFYGGAGYREEVIRGEVRR